MTWDLNEVCRTVSVWLNYSHSPWEHTDRSSVPKIQDVLH